MKILTFDLEDWFHILDNSQTKTEATGKNLNPEFKSAWTQF